MSRGFGKRGLLRTDGEVVVVPLSGRDLPGSGQRSADSLGCCDEQR